MAGIQAMGTSLTLKKKGSEGSDLVIANLSSIGEQSTEIEEIDVTTLDSPNGAKEYISGAKDSGSIEVTGNVVDEAQLVTLASVFNSGENRDFLITYPSTSTLAVTGYISKFTYGENTTDGLRTFSFSIRLSGAPVFTKKRNEKVK